jgi:hypothetical protein
MKYLTLQVTGKCERKPQWGCKFRYGCQVNKMFKGTAPSTGDLSPEKKEQTLLISSLFYILGVNWISTGCVIYAVRQYFFGF